jgi:hypothetical protein
MAVRGNSATGSIKIERLKIILLKPILLPPHGSKTACFDLLFLNFSPNTSLPSCWSNGILTYPFRWITLLFASSLRSAVFSSLYQPSLAHIGSTHTLPFIHISLKCFDILKNLENYKNSLPKNISHSSHQLRIKHIENE